MTTFDFEGGITGWTADPGVTLVHDTTESHGGSASLRIDIPDGDVEAVVYHDLDLPTGFYEVSAWVKSTVSTGANPRIRFDRYGKDVDGNATSSWSQMRGVLHVVKPTTPFTLVLRLSEGYPPSTSLWFDDISITPVAFPLAASADDLAGDADLRSRWSPSGWVTSTDQSHSGALSWKTDTAVPGLGWDEGPFGLAPVNLIAMNNHAVFTISAWVYVPSGNGPARLGTATSATSRVDYVESTLTDTWEKLTWVVPDWAVANDVDYGFSLGPVTVGDVAYWDDFEITATPTILEALVRDDTFDYASYEDESPTGDYWWWNWDGSELLSIDTTFGLSGKSMRVEVPSAWTPADSTDMRAAITYIDFTRAGHGTGFRIRAMVYVDPSSVGPVTMAVTDERGGTYVNVVSATTTKKGVWQRLEFNVSFADLSGPGWWDIYFKTTAGGPSLFWIDNLQVFQEGPVQPLAVVLEPTGVLVTDENVIGGTTEIALSPYAVLNTQVELSGSMDVDVDPSARAAWEGGEAALSSTLHLEVTSSAYQHSSWTQEAFDSDSGGGYGVWRPLPSYGYIGGTYTQSQWPSATSSTTQSHSASDSYKVTMAAEPVAMFGGIQAYSAMFLDDRYTADYPDYDVTVNVWVYVESGSAVRLELVNPSWAASMNADRGDLTYFSTILDSQTTTATATWQQLSVTVPASLRTSLPYGRVRLVLDDATVGGVFYIDDLTYDYDGTPRTQTVTWSPGETGQPGGDFPAYYVHGPTSGGLRGSANMLWGYSTVQARSGTKSFRFVTDARTSVGMAVAPVELWPWLDEDRRSLRMTVWVYVPSGSAPLMFGIAQNRYLSTDPYPDQALESMLMTDPVVSTKFDQWEKLVLDFNYWIYPGLLGYESGWDTLVFPFPPAVWPVTAPPVGDSYEYFVDDVSFEIRYDNMDMVVPLSGRPALNGTKLDVDLAPVNALFDDGRPNMEATVELGAGHPIEGVFVMGASMGVDVETGEGSLAVGAVSVAGATASAVVSVGGSFTVQAPVLVAGATAEVSTVSVGAATPFVGGPVVAGRYRWAPIEVFYDNITSPVTGTWYRNMVDTWWFHVTTTTPVMLAASVSGGGSALLFEGASEDYVEIVEPVLLSPGIDYFIEMYGAGYQLITLTGTLVPEISASITAEDVQRSPGTLRLYGGEFPALSPVVLTVVGTAVTATVSTDATGTITPRDMLVDGLNAGTYTLRAVSGSYVGTDTFTVLSNPLPAATSPSDAAPTIPVGTGVVKWMLRDPYVGGLTDFTFPINPTDMASPFETDQYQFERTVAESGQMHVWQAGLRAREWSFSGYLETQDFHDKLQAWKNIGRRFHLRDHRNRIWTVTFTDFQPTPMRAAGKPWAMKYTVTAFIYGTWVDAS